jgi:hypothetical protein
MTIFIEDPINQMNTFCSSADGYLAAFCGENSENGFESQFRLVALEKINQ